MQTLPTPSNSVPQPALSYTLEEWRSGYRSQPHEFSYWIENIEGEIPQTLTGTLFRNGPGLLDIGGHPLRHPFDGDGMISRIAFQNGRAHYCNRFVRTAGYVAEQATGKPVYRGVFGTQKPGGWLANAFDLRLKNIANTHVVYWGDKLLALWEAAEPHRLDPHSLDTLGLDNLEGVLQPGEAFAAHPRIDPGDAEAGRSPRLVNFGVKAGLSSTITLYEFEPTGQLVHKTQHTIPGFAFLHDFAVTPHYAIFFQNPVSFNPLPYVLGFKGAAECIRFNPKQPTQIIVIPRSGNDPVQIFDAPACFVFHHANAFEENGQLVVDSIGYQDFPSLDEGMGYQEVDFSTIPEGQLWRFILDFKTQRVDAQCVIPRCCEFPTQHPQTVGRPYRYLYSGTAHAPLGNAPLQAILKHDFHTGQSQVWSAAPHGFASEPVFVPHPEGTAEDDGWLLSVFYDGARQSSEVVILDARDLTTGPLARLKLRHHIPYGLHGSFVGTYFGPEMHP